MHKGDEIIISSDPLTKNGEWKAVKVGELVCFDKKLNVESVKLRKEDLKRQDN